MNEPERNYFISRELSWLDFNARVLDEAFCRTTPLLERLKFIAIFQSNLDEFFMVRVAGLRRMLRAGENEPDPAGLRPSEQLPLIRRKVEKLLRRCDKCLYADLLPELERQNLRLRRVADLAPATRAKMRHFFEQQILPVLTPLAVDPSHPFPIVNNGAIEIAVGMTPEGGSRTVRAFVEVPEGLPRFLEAPDGLPGKTFVALEDLVMSNLDALFSGCCIQEFFPFRVTRDMDFSIESDGGGDLLHAIEKQILQRRQRDPIRLELPLHTAGPLAEWLLAQFRLSSQFCYLRRGILHAKQLFQLTGLAGFEHLLEPAWPPLEPSAFRPGESVFRAIARSQGLLLALPFHSFSPVLRFLEEAADDPDVLAIKQTLYRVSGKSPVVRALQRAAQNGKQVTVIVELKARFDENNNIQWARRLEESGAHVVYGISGLKIHCKALLVVRKEAGMIRRYVHCSTGNYNDKTAQLYTDIGIFSADPDLAFDVSTLFNVMTGYSSVPEAWRKVAVSPFDLRRKLTHLIRREAENAIAGTPGRILAKMNSLSDPGLIRELHEAAEKGVEIDLVVRGICCLTPDLPNLRIRSIVDRYLEHSRVFFFENGGRPELYCSSADFMVRNLDRRIELMFPIEDAKQRKILLDLLAFQLADTQKVRVLQSSGIYSRAPENTVAAGRSQLESYEYFRKLESGAPGSTLPVYESKPKEAPASCTP